MRIAVTFVHAYLLVYAALFPVINPIGDTPAFLNLTQFCTSVQRHALARKVAIGSFFLLLGSMFVGSHVLGFFGLDLPIVQIGGGIVVATLGWKLLNTPMVPDARSADAFPSTLPDAFYPLTLPLTVDPGAMSVAITIGSHHSKSADTEHLLLLGLAATAGLIGISLTIYLCYRFGERLMLLVGRDVMKIVLRLSAFILFCIGIEIFWTGWAEIAQGSR